MSKLNIGSDDFFKEVMRHYREIVDQLDIVRIRESPSNDYFTPRKPADHVNETTGSRQ